MARYVGNNMYISFKGTSVAADYQSMDVDREMKMVEATAGADAAATFLNTYKDGSVKITLFDLTDGTAATAYKNLFVEGASGTLIWGEEGTATNKPKHTLTNATVKKLSEKFKFDDKVELTIEVQPNSSSFISDSAW